MNQLTQKLHTVDNQSQGSSLMVNQKDIEWKEKVGSIEKEHGEEILSLKKVVEQAQNDKQLISKSYESQL